MYMDCVYRIPCTSSEARHSAPSVDDVREALRQLREVLSAPPGSDERRDGVSNIAPTSK